MNFFQRLRMVLAAASIALGQAACDNKPFERAGKVIDRGVERTTEKIKEVTR